jgi:hypothetical protein
MPAVGLTFEALLLWRLFRHRQLKRYAYLSSFLLFELIRSPALVTVYYFNREWYSRAYWNTEGVGLAVFFAILWEVARHLFPSGSPLRRLAWQAVLLSETILIPSLLMLAWGWSASNFDRYPVLKIWPLVEQYFTLAVSLLLLVIAGVARYYGVSFGRNMRGLIAGFGVYLCLYAANFAALQTVPRFHVFWQFISSVSYSAMVACWLWAFWKFAPSPSFAPEFRAPASWKSRWSGDWQTALGDVRHWPN